MRPRLDMVRLAVGPVSLSLALAVGSCGSAVPVLAYAEDALELVEDGEVLENLEDEGEFVADEEFEPESEQIEPEPEPETGQGEPEPEPETGQGEPEPEPETGQGEPEPEPETGQGEPETEQGEEVESAVDLSPVVDLLMLCAGSLGVLVGYHAFSGFWRVLGGEQ